MAKAVCKPKTGWEYTTNPEWYRNRQYAMLLVSQLKSTLYSMSNEADDFTRGKLHINSLFLSQLHENLESTNLIPKEDK